MSTTEFRQGYNEAKPTSRVLKPPGGGSSNIFGSPQYDAPAPASSKKNNPNRNSSDIFSKAPEPVSTGGQLPGVQKENVGRRDHPPPETNRAINIITGLPNPCATPPVRTAPKETKPQAAAPAPVAPVAAPAASDSAPQGVGGAPRPPKIPTPSTRVSQPPGGRCSQLW